MHFDFVMPAQAGIQIHSCLVMDAGLRWHDSCLFRMDSFILRFHYIR